jgi:hypothetical protein
MMNTKPRLNFWALWNMSFGYVGIQFGFALQNANVSRRSPSSGSPGRSPASSCNPSWAT